jgi:undecaprenyl-diphosphatase
MAALIGAESLVVNQGVKRLFGRIRPTEAGDPRFPVRRPSTSSFPSGHASRRSLPRPFSPRPPANEWRRCGTRRRRSWPVSRAYVRIHHPSDVVAGAAVGVVLGRIGSKIFKAIT